MSRDSSVSITLGYGLDGRSSIPGSGKEISLLRTQPASYPMVTRGSLPWGKAAEGYRSPRPTAEFRSGGAIPPLPHTSLWSVSKLIKHRDNFTLR
jgi:hypothetical protein